MMEPWDGPACVVFTDGTQVGAVLDRNGLRPSRYWVTDDGLVVLASEVGVLDIDPATVVRKGRLQPGRMFLVDTERAPDHRGRGDQGRARRRASLRRVAARGDASTSTTSPTREHIVHTHASVTRRQQIFGYTEEEKRVLLTPMAKTGAEPIGSMGTDTPDRRALRPAAAAVRLLRQLFAQVTNPPLDAIREELVTSLAGTIGPEANLLEPTPASCRQVVLPFPVIDNDELVKIRHINRDGDLPGFITHVVSRASTTSRAAERRWPSASRRSAPRCPRRSPAAPGSSCSPTGTRPRSWPRSRRCCSPAPSTTTWCARRPARRSAWSSRPATSARCTTSRC